MSDCGFCIGGYDCDGYPEFSDLAWPKARKEHRCGECARTILKGEVYNRWSGKFDGELFRYKTCAQCYEIRLAFSCTESDQTGPPQGELWSDIYEMMFPRLTTACFDKLQTPQAKAFLQKKWIEWKGITSGLHTLESQPSSESPTPASDTPPQTRTD